MIALAVAGIAAAASIWGGFAGLTAEPWRGIDGDTARQGDLVITLEYRCARDGRQGEMLCRAAPARQLGKEALPVDGLPVVYGVDLEVKL